MPVLGQSGRKKMVPSIIPFRSLVLPLACASKSYKKEARVVHSPEGARGRFTHHRLTSSSTMLFLLDHSSPFFRAVHFVDDCRHTLNIPFVDHKQDLWANRLIKAIAMRHSSSSLRTDHKVDLLWWIGIRVNQLACNIAFSLLVVITHFDKHSGGSKPVSDVCARALFTLYCMLSSQTPLLFLCD